MVRSSTERFTTNQNETRTRHYQIRSAAKDFRTSLEHDHQTITTEAENTVIMNGNKPDKCINTAKRKDISRKLAITSKKTCDDTWKPNTNNG
ncbi:hypothetical protein RDWZM_002172 [Blomia tropicalis]|uniref:Uncharacterized protein n=1 Tax=Blomia tropicalis TaxID=40697 RepID=A0A9Q0MDJ6_BLOTA|nr:hypothetical protein RDWZM_002172 [Blomia tropicalis]